MSTPETVVPIALLSQVGEASRHLRDALAGAGTPIVYEAHASQLDRDALEQSGARVVVVNLDADVDAQLDEVHALLGDERYNVIFNEAQVSAQLSGWEQARWARHLAAKILGSDHADPPRPAGAEPVPVRAAMPPAAPVPSGVAVVAGASTQVADVPAASEDLDADDQVERAGDAALAAIEARFAEPAAPAGFAAEFVDADALAPAPQPSFADEFADDDTADDIVMASEDALGFADLDDFAGDDASATEFDAQPAAAQADDGVDLAFDLADMHEAVPPAPPPTRSLDPEIEIAAAAEAIEAAVEPGQLADLELLDLDWADAPAPPPGEEVVDEPVAPPPPVSHEAFAWSLVDDDEANADDDAAVPAKPAEFGIETISAAEYLAPASGPEAPATRAPTAASAFTLELVPLDEAVAPQAKQEYAARDNWLDTATPKAASVQRVWVLGASIGGPEAVREFLARIPKDYPALFLLAQHMGPEFVDLMAQQLAKTTALTVRMPTHGERVAHGDIVIVPLAQRLRVDREGVVVLEPIGEPQAAHRPSIDQLLCDIGDRFGAKAGAIIFSGMAEDSAEGSRHLVDKGGKVYVQDPRTCVISSMVDGVLETGVVSFTGSPLELADRLLGERPRPSAG